MRECHKVPGRSLGERVGALDRLFNSIDNDEIEPVKKSEGLLDADDGKGGRACDFSVGGRASAA